MLDDKERSTVFDAAARILEFGFSEDVAASFFGEFLKADERSFSNCWSELV